MRTALPLMLFSASFCLALGLVLPLMSVERLFVFADEASLVTLVMRLWSTGDPLLAATVGMFSIVFPSIKLAMLHLAAYGGIACIPVWVRMLSRWSMLDVMLVALVIFAVKTTGLATAATKPGLWFFAASALLGAGASALAKRSA